MSSASFTGHLVREASREASGDLYDLLRCRQMMSAYSPSSGNSFTASSTTSILPAEPPITSR